MTHLRSAFLSALCALATSAGAADSSAGHDELTACPGAYEYFRHQDELGKQRDAQMGAVTLPKLQAQLLHWAKADAEVRKDLNPQALGDSERASALMRRLAAIDRVNYAHIKGVVDEYGFPTFDMVGGDGAAAAWLLVQHQDARPEFQSFVLDLITPLAKRGAIDPHSFAMLTDRVLQSQHQPQRYGSQFNFEKDGGLTMAPTIDVAHLDQRRAAIGLESIAVYRCLMEQQYRRR